MLMIFWRKLWLFGLQGPPPIPLFRNYLEEGLYCSLIEGLLFVTLTATSLCIFGAVGVICNSITDRELFNRQLPLSENYENAVFGKS